MRKLHSALSALVMLSGTCVSAEGLLCEELWATAVFPSGRGEAWREEGIVPQGRYVIESTEFSSQVKNLSLPEDLQESPCKSFLNGDLYCEQQMLRYDAKSQVFSRVADFGDFTMFSMGLCTEF